eukprot:337623_1
MDHLRSRSYSPSFKNKKKKINKTNKNNQTVNKYINYKCIKYSKNNEEKIEYNTIKNGIIGKFVTETFAMEACKFWSCNISILSKKEFQHASTVFF